MVSRNNGWPIRVDIYVSLDPNDSDCLHQKAQDLAVSLDLFFGGNRCGLHALKTLAAVAMRRANFNQHRFRIGSLVQMIRAVRVSTMRLVIARCTVDYDGRLTAHLPEAVRLIMVKADGCVAIHATG